MKKIFFAIAIVIFTLTSTYAQLPDVDLINMKGETVNSQSIIDNKTPFAICFWAVWNKTSLLELNILMEQYKDWHDEYGVELYAICVDEKKRIPRAKAYIDAHDWKYKVLFDENGKMENKMKINGVPHLILFDKNGNIVWQEHSYDSGLEDTFLDEVHKLK